MTANKTYGEVVLTGSFAGWHGGRIDLDKAGVTMTFIGTFDVDAQLWAVVASPACTFVNICRHTVTIWTSLFATVIVEETMTCKQIGK